MKFYSVILAFYFFAATADAHPKADDHYSAVPVGSTLTVLEDINLVPNKLIHAFGFGGMMNDADSGGISCEIEVDKVVAFDRVIPKGTTYNLVSTPYSFFKNYPTVRRIVFELNSQTIRSVNCWALTGPYSYRTEGGDVSINLLEYGLSKYFKLDMAPPVRVR